MRSRRKPAELQMGLVSFQSSNQSNSDKLFSLPVARIRVRMHLSWNCDVINSFRKQKLREVKINTDKGFVWYQLKLWRRLEGAERQSACEGAQPVQWTTLIAHGAVSSPRNGIKPEPQILIDGSLATIHS
jgi:hypothetical protein